ncbi:hypothetical protein [Prevotella melaninogenica]|nr:hypothetical protein [uncultured Prevotella sp.]
MKRFLFISSLLIGLLTFAQCKSNSTKNKTFSVKEQMNNENKKMNVIDSLKYWGVNKDKLLKHLKLQELAWFGGDFRDDQSKPRYMPTQEDFLLTIPLVEHYLYTHGFKKPSKELFEKRIKQVFGKDLGANTKSTFINLSNEESFDFASSFFAIKDKGFITYNWLLRDLISVNGNTIKFKSTTLKQILLLNKFLIYNDTGALKQLELYQGEGEIDDIGDYYDSNRMLGDLLKEYSYFGSPELNQWFFNAERENPFAFLCYIFDKGKGNNLIVHPELIETIEKNTTGKNSSYYNDKFLIYVYQVLQDEDGMNAAHFNLEQKARMFCYLANSEYKMRNKYADYIPSTNWAQTSMTYVIMTNCEKVYQYARAHKFFGISSPEMMDKIEREGLDLNPPTGSE